MKKLSITGFITASVFACLLACSPAIAQNKTELQAISDKMFAEGDLHFVLVEAYNDELLYEGQSYDFAYNKGVVTINEQPLPAAFSEKYAIMIREFEKGAEGTMFSLKGGGLVLSEILDPESNFRKSHANMEKNRAKSMRNEIANTRILNELSKDGLVDTATGYNIGYDYRGFYVNGKKLEGKEQEKYVSMYIASGGKELLAEKDGTMSMTKASKTQR